MKKFIWCILLSIIFSGCVFHSEPKDEVNISKAVQLESLSGVYSNKGDPKGLLSEILFGYLPIRSMQNDLEIQHNEIDKINVLVKDNVVTAEAIANECIIYKKEYINGKDFTLENGTITLKSDFFILTRGSGDPLVGPSYEKIELGIDEKKHGIYKYQLYAAGLVFLFLPIAATEVSEVRFARLHDNMKYSNCSNQTHIREP